MSTATIEVVNSQINQVFTNAHDGDGIIATSSSNQGIHFGQDPTALPLMSIKKDGITINTHFVASNIISTSNLFVGGVERFNSNGYVNIGFSNSVNCANAIVLRGQYSNVTFTNGNNLNGYITCDGVLSTTTISSSPAITGTMVFENLSGIASVGTLTNGTYSNLTLTGLATGTLDVQTVFVGASQVLNASTMTNVTMSGCTIVGSTISGFTHTGTFTNNGVISSGTVEATHMKANDYFINNVNINTMFSQPFAMRYWQLAATQSIADSIGTNLIFSNTIYASNNLNTFPNLTYNTVSKIWVNNTGAPITFYVSSSVWFAAGKGGRTLYIRCNDLATQDFFNQNCLQSTTSTYSTQLTTGGFLKLGVGEWFAVRVWQNSGAALNATMATTSIMLLS